MTMTELEIDLIEYVAQRRNESFAAVEKSYVRLCDRWAGGLQGKQFRKCTSDIQTIFGFFHNPKTEASILEAYKTLDSVHLLIYLASTLPKRFSQRLQSGIALLKLKQYKDFLRFGCRYLKSNIKNKPISDLLLENLSGTPVIVDYGCGVAQLSLDICTKSPSAKAYLVDIDMIIQDFAFYRFQKRCCHCEILTITEENLHPDLPEHNLCIANEVMEHVFEPLRVLEKIDSAMVNGGILYGNFANHERHMLHVSPDLSALRERIKSNYECVETKIYKKLCLPA